MSECQQHDGTYVPCTCYVHDFVAELLDIDSTNPDGYKSTKTRGLKFLDRDGKPLKPKEIYKGGKQPPTPPPPPRGQAKAPRPPLLSGRANEDVEYVYEFGKAEPVDVIVTTKYSNSWMKKDLERLQYQQTKEQAKIDRLKEEMVEVQTKFRTTSNVPE